MIQINRFIDGKTRLLRFCIIGALIGLPFGAFAKDKLLLKQTDYGVGLMTGSTMLQYHTTCVLFAAFFVSGNFFEGLKPGVSSQIFYKGNRSYREFPDPLVVDIEAHVSKCPANSHYIIPPNYAADFMTSPSFEVKWRKGEEDWQMVSNITTKEEHVAPSRKWNYFLTIPFRGVPLNAVFVIDVSMRRGTAHSEINASLNSALSKR